MLTGRSKYSLIVAFQRRGLDGDIVLVVFVGPQPIILGVRHGGRQLPVKSTFQRYIFAFSGVGHTFLTQTRPSWMGKKNKSVPNSVNKDTCLSLGRVVRHTGKVSGTCFILHYTRVQAIV